jgi:hypothetical protein
MKRMFDFMQEMVTVVIIFWGGILLPLVATLAWLNHGWPTTTRDWMVAGVAMALTLFAWAVAFREYHQWGDRDRLFWRSAKFVASLFTGWSDAIRELKARGWYNPGPEPRVETRVKSQRVRDCGKCRSLIYKSQAALWPSDGPAMCHFCHAQCMAAVAEGSDIVTKCPMCHDPWRGPVDDCCPKCWDKYESESSSY